MTKFIRQNGVLVNASQQEQVTTEGGKGVVALRLATLRYGEEHSLSFRTMTPNGLWKTDDVKLPECPDARKSLNLHLLKQDHMYHVAIGWSQTEHTEYPVLWGISYDQPLFRHVQYDVQKGTVNKVDTDMYKPQRGRGGSCIEYMITVWMHEQGRYAYVRVPCLWQRGLEMAASAGTLVGREVACYMEHDRGLKGISAPRD